MLPCILAMSASYLGRLRLLLEPVDHVSLPDRLTVDGVLEPFNHGLEVLKAFLQNLETPPVLVAVGICCSEQRAIGAVEAREALERELETLRRGNGVGELARSNQ
jgi:hypothetical protein